MRSTRDSSQRCAPTRRAGAPRIPRPLDVGSMKAGQRFGCSTHSSGPAVWVTLDEERSEFGHPVEVKAFGEARSKISFCLGEPEVFAR